MFKNAVVRFLFAVVLAAGAAEAQVWYELTDLGSLVGNGESLAWSVNDSGQVVGTSGFYAFLWEDGVMTNIGDLGGTRARAYHISNAGHIVGDSSDELGVYHAFLYFDGQMTDLGTIGGNRSVGFGVNSHGHVVGQSKTASGLYHAFLHDGVEMIDLGTLGGTFSVAQAINDDGVIVGQAEDAEGRYTSFIYENGEMRDIGTLGGSFAQAFAINNQKVVAGASLMVNDSKHGFSWDETNGMIDLGDLGRPPSEAYSINEAGYIVGYSDMPDRHPGLNPFMYDHGTMYDLNEHYSAAGQWVLDVARGINNNGVIVGYGVLGEIQARGFLLTPAFCPADFNEDGIVNTLDFLAFLNAYNVIDPGADFNGDGVVNTLDFLGFLNAYSRGCG